LAPLTGDGLDRAGYVQALRAFLGFFCALEPVLQARGLPFAAGHEGSYRYLSRALPLKQDLLDLDAADAVEKAHLDHRLPIPCLETPDHVLGTLYVLEGATQGGHIIAPHVSRTLGLHALFGARYFHLYTHQQWQLFRALVVSRESQHDCACVADGARSTFTALMAHLDANTRI